jgi:hypothetical protein
MKNALSPLAVLVFSLVAGSQTFSAVVEQTDADVPAPEVQTYCATPANSNVLTELLKLGLNYLVVQTKFLQTTRRKWRRSRAVCPMN